MHKYKVRYIGEIEMNSQVINKSKSKFIDDVDKLRFKPRAAYHNTSMM